MFVLFRLSNFMSYKEDTELNLMAMDEYKDHKNVLLDSGEDDLLRVVAIYGANASGKSNLFDAFSTFRKIVIESNNLNGSDEDSLLKKNYRPYTLKGGKGSTDFQIIAITNGREYTYGFEYDENEIIREWLYRRELKKTRKSVLFERYSNKIVKFNQKYPSHIKNISKLIRKDVLILTLLNALKDCHIDFKEIFQYIANIKIMGTDFYEAKSLLEKKLPIQIEKDKRGLIEFLDACDVGITDIGFENFGEGRLIYTKHMGEEDGFKLPLYRESEGTLKSIALYIYVKEVIDSSSTMFIDELNVKLHPLMLKFIIDLFYKKSSKAQLIYSSHDTTLLDSRFFRRDQIYFVEKDEKGKSELVPLSDYKYKKGENIGSNYLAGVYGAIPYLKDYEVEVSDES